MFATIENIRLRAIALRSSIHNEQQLSAIELSGMAAKKTNELIDVVNELCEVIKTIKDEHITMQLQYDAATETLRLIAEEGI